MAQLTGGTRRRVGPCLRLAVWVSLALLGLRLNTAQGLGFGDAEALYACYALHPQPAYLDHPGLLGFLLRLLGGGAAPSPEIAHATSSVLATMIPWLAALTARLSGLDWERASRAVLALALIPEFCVGLFGVSPDLPMATCWLAALALVAHLLRVPAAHRSSAPALLAWLGLGVALGLGMLAKVSTVLLSLSLLLVSLRKDVRPVWRGIGPWCTATCIAILVAPLVTWEFAHGLGMLEHRLVTTQANAGFSPTNLFKLLGGQLVYVTPPFLLAAWFVGRDLYAKRRTESLSATLWWTMMLPLVLLSILSLWSDRAEPHWIAPALLPLAIHAARTDLISRRLASVCLITGALFALVVWASVKTTAFIWLAKSPAGEALGGYQPRYDLTNDLYAWGPGKRLLEQAVESVIQNSGEKPSVVGAPHWMICAQAHAAIGTRAPVGCYSAIPTDFDRWTPSEAWRSSSTILLVQDSRYPVDVAREFPSRRQVSTWRTQVRRGQHLVRTIRISALEKSSGWADRSLENHPAGEMEPAAGR